MAKVLTKEKIIKILDIEEGEYDKAKDWFCGVACRGLGERESDIRFREEATRVTDRGDRRFFRARFHLPQKGYHDELTTLMHAEFMEGEISELQLRCLAAWAQMERGGKSKDEALLANGLTEKEYDENIEAAFKA